MNSIDDEELILDTLKHAFTLATHIKVTEKSIGGDNLNFTSDIVNLTVEYEENNKSEVKYLILKIPVINSPSFPFYLKLNVYDREARTYEKVLPHINELMDVMVSPKHFHTTDSNIFVLENLAMRGYKIAPGSKFLSREQFNPLLKTLAKFHAASHLVYQQHPHLSAEDVFRGRVTEGMQIMVDNWSPVLCEILERSNASQLIPKLKKAFSVIKCENGLNYSISSTNFNFVVYNHGDYRRENLLIKYTDNGQVTDVKMVDFQFCMWSTPVFDFLYCMILSAQVEMIEEHFDSFVDFYVRNLQDALLALDCSELYGVSNFMADFEKIKLSMVFDVVALCCILMASISRRNQEMFTSDEKKQTDILYGECLDDAEFIRIVAHWLKYCEKVGAL